MNIYVAHSRTFDFQKELYQPIRTSSLYTVHTFTLPHETSGKPFNSKEYLRNQCDVLIAEVSHPSTGIGIELGWADGYGVPIVCVYMKGSTISDSLKTISTRFVEYADGTELVSGIEAAINQIMAKEQEGFSS